MAKILVAEDAPEVRSNIVRLLQLNNYEVIEAVDGKEAIEKAILFTPDLIISDIMMPHKSGIEFLVELRDNVLFAQIPFIFLSAKMDLRDIRHGMSLGAEDYLTKPFRAKELLEAVELQLQKKEQAAIKFKDMYQGITLYIPHELRTPLVGIMGYTDILLDDIDSLDAATAKNMLQGIKKLSQRLYKRLDKFITFANIELLLQNPSMLRTYNLHLVSDPGHFLSESINNHVIQSDRKSDVTANIETARLVISEEYFKVLIEEILDNAFKFSFPGDAIDVSATIIGNKYCFSVKSEGRGMTHEEFAATAPHIQHARENFDQDGNGLGLIIALKISKLFNVEYSFVGEKSKFAHFTFMFPINDSL